MLSRDEEPVADALEGAEGGLQVLAGVGGGGHGADAGLALGDGGVGDGEGVDALVEEHPLHALGRALVAHEDGGRWIYPASRTPIEPNTYKAT